MAGHHHIDADAGDRRVGAAIAVNLLLTVAQIVGGILAGSMALIADAIHNLSDAMALVIAFAARKIARRPANAEMPFGYGRIEVVAALINYTTLIIIGIYLTYEAVWRLFDPQPVDGWLVVILAGVALIIDIATAMLTFSMSKNSVNIRAAFLHNLADAAASVAVIIAGTLILLYDWRLVDPAVTLLIAGYIIWMSFKEIGGVIRILMLGAPDDLALDDVIAAIKDLDGVTDVHQAYLWQMQEHAPAFQAHVVLRGGEWVAADALKQAIKARLADKFGIRHTTIELECAQRACVDAHRIGGMG
ncbi:MAG: cation transporter [Thalassobium sp.]|uniref:cation diffusion facilitator family transporter n=1 Tax=Octadecabacter sp. SW4 TaxID=2602067 RepID=UPI000C0C8311|nr:cation diffusion facilitator family transporter [Octadecabacter sp. SW4]PHQ81127.1 MAG: cation transporter [Thalassobium sp.]QEE34339.1 cation transporter [Octadecabacter sp. SW4]